MRRIRRNRLLPLWFIMPVALAPVGCEGIGPAVLAGIQTGLTSALSGDSNGAASPTPSNGDEPATSIFFINESPERITGTVVIRDGGQTFTQALNVDPQFFHFIAEVCIDSFQVLGVGQMIVQSFDIALTQGQDYVCGQSIALAINADGDPEFRVLPSGGPQSTTTASPTPSPSPSPTPFI
jgi:hypothetical protein